MKKTLEVIKLLFFAAILIFIMEIVTVIIILVVEMNGLSAALIDSNKLLLTISLIGEISLPLFLFYYYRHNKKELKIVMPFKKKNIVQTYLIGYFIGLFIFFLVWFGAVSLGGFTVTFSWSLTKLPWFLAFFVGYGVQGLAEEILFRGYLQGRLMQTVSVNLAIIISAIFFAFFHIGNAGVTIYALFELFLFGLATGIVRYQSNNLWGVGALHSAWNFAQGPIFGVAISGSVGQSFVFESVQVPNKAWVNGGVFGLEGSLFSLLAHLLLLGSTYIWWQSRIKKKAINEIK